MASAICTGVGRSIQYLHMPGPKDRTDDAYFRRRGACGLAHRPRYGLSARRFDNRGKDRVLEPVRKMRGLNQEAEGAFGCEGYLPHWLVLKSPRPRFYGLN